MKKCRPGLVSISFRGNSPEEILEYMKKSGLSIIEWGSDVHAPKDDPQKLGEIAALQKKYGIECCSYGTYFHLGVTPVEELDGYIAAAKILGTDILRLWCGDKNSQEYSSEERDELFRQCRIAAGIAESRGVKLCMECHNNTYTNKKEAALELMEAIGSDAFLMYWQPDQFVPLEENVACAKLISRFVTHLHVFNWEGHDRFPMKDGVEKWLAYLSCFEGEHALLLEFMPDDRIESLETEAAALMKIAEANR